MHILGPVAGPGVHMHFPRAVHRTGKICIFPRENAYFGSGRQARENAYAFCPGRPPYPKYAFSLGKMHIFPVGPAQGKCICTPRRATGPKICIFPRENAYFGSRGPPRENAYAFCRGRPPDPKYAFSLGKMHIFGPVVGPGKMHMHFAGAGHRTQNMHFP